MSSPPPPPVTPWHRRVLDWLSGEPADSVLPPDGLAPGERFPWEPVPPAPRPPQWGAANLPALLLGQDEEDAASPDAAARAHGATLAAPLPAPTPSPQPGMAS